MSFAAGLGELHLSQRWALRFLGAASVLSSLFGPIQALAQSEPFVEAEAPELPDSRSNLATQVAVDGEILLVGDPSAVVGTGLGAFYSLSRSQDRWAYEATVTASDGAMSDAFATSV